MRITAISGSRADRAALEPVADAVGANKVYLTVDPCSHLVESTVSSARALVEAAANILHYETELVIIPGDRYEILAAAFAAHLLNVPIAHLGGGDWTEGSLDNSMRNAVSKLAHLHFPACHESAHNLLMMGEEAWRVNVTGDPAIDGLAKAELYSKEDTLKLLGVTDPFYLVAYQPATLLENPTVEAKELLKALDKLKAPCVFTSLNNDPFGKQIEILFKQFCSEHEGVLLEMDRKLYLSAMRHCLVMIGNSSSGIYEAPSLKKPFINIGDRQQGRLTADSVINTQPHADSIVVATAAAKRMDCSKVKNPYGDGKAVQRICQVIANLPPREVLLRKKRGELAQWLTTRFGSESTEVVLGGGGQRKNLYDGWQDTLTRPARLN